MPTPLAICPKVEIEVLRSTKRTKTVQARKLKDKIVISIPASMTQAEEKIWITTMTTRIQQRYPQAIDLTDRTQYLCSRYSLPLPSTIDWVDNQNTRWGSCSIESQRIRISSRIQQFPLWVLDYVIIHELTHLIVASHNSQFWQLVHRYAKTERSIGFLIAKGST